jgi:methylmalonyl-CoA/ethylmalonyl-CoA epimerase
MDLKIGRLLEVALGVGDLAAAGRQFSRLLCAPISPVIEERANFSMRFQMCRLGDVDFEIMQSSTPDGLIQRFVDRRGEGLHHVAFLVDDAEAALAHFKAKGVPVLSEAPIVIANLKAFFLAPACLAGVLVEFIENLHPWLDGVKRPANDAALGSAQALTSATIEAAGVLVPDLTAAITAYEDVLGAVSSAPQVLAALGVMASRCRVANFEFTLMQPHPDLPQSPALAARRAGLHHVSLRVGDLDGAVARLQAAGIPRVEACAANGRGLRSVFMDPLKLHGVMLELAAS